MEIKNLWLVKEVLVWKQKSLVGERNLRMKEGPQDEKEKDPVDCLYTVTVLNGRLCRQ